MKCCDELQAQIDHVRDEFTQWSNRTKRQEMIIRSKFCNTCGSSLQTKMEKTHNICKGNTPNCPFFEPQHFAYAPQEVMKWCKHNKNMAGKYRRCEICNPSPLLGPSFIKPQQNEVIDFLYINPKYQSQEANIIDKINELIRAWNKER